MGVGVLLSIPFYVSLVAAFYPYVPEYRCLEDLHCVGSSSKRSTSEKVNLNLISKESLVFPLKRKTPKGTFSHDLHIENVVKRLTGKYHNRGTHVDNAGTTEKRSNDYSIVVANTPTQPNSVALNQDGTDFSYFASVKFGSSGKSLYMLMDTGADSTWIMASSCTSDACAKHNTFGSSDSTTLQISSNAFSIQYGSGSVTGKYASDTLAVAGMSLNATFGLATTTSSDFLSFPFDGIMGLARSNSPPAFIESVIASKQLKSNIFGININRNSDGAKDGEISFGSADASKFTGSLTYSAVSGTSGGWVIPVDDIGVNGKKSGVTGKTAYIDTGTSYAFIPPADLVSLYANIPGANLGSDGMTYSVPCSTTSSIQIYISGVAYSILAKDWVGGKVGDTCTSNLYARAIVGSSWLIGDIFLKNVYAVFDADQNRIGLAQKSGSGTSVASAAAASSSGGLGKASSSLIVSSPFSSSSSIPALLQSTTHSQVVSASPSSSMNTQTSITLTATAKATSFTQSSTTLQNTLPISVPPVSNAPTTASSASQITTSSTSSSQSAGKSSSITTNPGSLSGSLSAGTSSAIPFVNVPTSGSTALTTGSSRATDTAQANIAATASPSNVSAASTLLSVTFEGLLTGWSVWLLCNILLFGI